MVRWWLNTLGAVVAAAGISVALVGANDDLSIAGMLILILLAGSSAGVFLGFLFAVPRSSSEAPDSPGDAGAAAQGNSKRLLWTNTNLSKVSDWLTTMLVGVGLTQLHAINGYLYGFRLFLADATEASNGVGADLLPFGGPLLLIFATCAGFILMYMHMRLNLVPLLNKAEQDLSGAAKAAVQEAARNVGGPTSDAIGKSADVSVDDGLNVMFTALYRPDGHKQVIDLGRRLAATPAVNRAEYWFYLAAAHGQRYDVAEGRDKARERRDMLDAARRAVQLDASFRGRLWLISDPNGQDNDLASFRQDPEFLEIVGQLS